jgi:hypothetical protein
MLVYEMHEVPTILLGVHNDILTQGEEMKRKLAKFL